MEIQALHDRMQRAYERGDHAEARGRARELLDALPQDDERLRQAQAVLRETEPDPFIFVLCALGLGVVAWLVYKYVP